MLASPALNFARSKMSSTSSADLPRPVGHHLEVLALDVGEVGVLQQQLDVAADHRQRRAQLVPGDREQLLAQLVELL